MNERLIATIGDKKAILFDLFHTLTWLEITPASGPITSQSLGVEKEDWTRQLLACSRDRLVGKITDPYQIIRGMAHAIDPTISEETIIRTTDNRIRQFATSLIDIPSSSLTVLTALRDAGKTLALISNADVMEAQAWPQSPAAKLFDATLFSYQVGCAKPEPEIFQMCLQQLALGPDQCIFVGDGGSGELKAAQDCGMSTVMITGIIQKLWPDKIEGRKEHADFVIENISELLDSNE